MFFLFFFIFLKCASPTWYGQISPLGLIKRISSRRITWSYHPLKFQHHLQCSIYISLLDFFLLSISHQYIFIIYFVYYLSFLAQTIWKYNLSLFSPILFSEYLEQCILHTGYQYMLEKWMNETKKKSPNQWCSSQTYNSDNTWKLVRHANCSFQVFLLN